MASTACTTSETGGSPPPGSGLGAGDLALPATERWPNGSWAGKVEGTDAFIALVAGTDGFVAYVCDDATIGQWFRTDEAAGALVVSSQDDATLTAARRGDDVVGTVRLEDGSAHAFTAPPAKEPVHYSEGFDETDVALAGWVTLPSGERRGTLALTSRLVAPGGSVPAVTVPPISGGPVSPVLPVSKGTVITPAPALSLDQPITVPKTTVTTVKQLELPPANPLTPDSVNPATANNTKFVWSAIGDSYASGEGSPVRKGEFLRPFFNIVTKTDWGPAVPDSGVSVDERASCHRSAIAGAPLANEKLKAAFPDVRFEFSHFACSGAEIFDVMHPMPNETNIEGYDGPDLNNHVKQGAQGERAAVWAAGKNQYDALYLSIGGNDVGFGDVISECLVGFREGDECSDKPLTRAADPRSGRPAITIADAIARLPGSYRDLNAYLRSPARPARPGTILISKSPDPSKGDNGVDCGGVEGHMDGDLLQLVSKKEMAWARDEILNKGINDSVQTTGTPTDQGGLGWTIVDGHLPLFENHGLCAQGGRNFINTNNDALEQQGDDYDASVGGVPLRTVAMVAFAAIAGGAAATTGGGILLAPTVALAAAIVAAGVVHLGSGLVHPNAQGFQAYATAINAKMEPLVKAKLVAGLRAPTRVRVASAVNNGEIVVRWDDKSTSEDRYEVTVTRLEGTAAVPSAPIRLDRNVQELRLPANGRLAARFEVRACVRDVCSDAGSTDGVNFVPSVPTNGQGSYSLTRVERLANSNRATAFVGWTASPFALKYVIAYRQVDPTGSTSGQVTPNTPFAGLAIKEPPHTTTGNDKALYAFKISACSRVGCSPFSSEVQVDTRGTPPPVKVIAASSLPLGFDRPELVIEGGNLVTANPLPLPTRDGLLGGTPSATLPNPSG